MSRLNNDYVDIATKYILPLIGSLFKINDCVLGIQCVNRLITGEFVKFLFPARENNSYSLGNPRAFHEDFQKTNAEFFSCSNRIRRSWNPV